MGLPLTAGIRELGIKISGDIKFILKNMDGNIRLDII